MLIRQLKYLVALASERHFGRAASACNISQPTLSASIRQLETELGVPIVERGHRFNGLTPEGEQVLESARRIISEAENLQQSLSRMRQGLSGKLRLGVIPTALPMMQDLARRFMQLHPAVTLQIHSQTSQEIQQGIDNFTLDAGVTYLDNEPLVRVKAKPLYEQSFSLLTRADGPLASQSSITWRDAAKLRLCLLTPDMQNRRIIDGVFRTIGKSPKPVVETNSILILCSHAAIPGMASIVPSQLLTSFILPSDTMALHLVDPNVTRTIGVIIADREPPVPLAQILFDMARSELRL